MQSPEPKEALCLIPYQCDERKAWDIFSMDGVMSEHLVYYDFPNSQFNRLCGIIMHNLSIRSD
jgi:hypothetical protein